MTTHALQMLSGAKHVLYHWNRIGKPSGSPARVFLTSPLLLERIREWVAVDQLPTKGPDLTPDYRWKTCTAPSLRGHIVYGHLSIVGLALYGVPRYDLEVLVHRGFDARWIVKKVYERLERTDYDIIQEALKRNRLHLNLWVYPDAIASPQGYRAMLVKTLLYIEQLGLAKVDWDRVERSLSGTRKTELDIEKDSQEGSFFIYAAVA